MVFEQSAPRLAKSAERIDGAMIAGGAIVVSGGEFLGEYGSRETTSDEDLGELKSVCASAGTMLEALDSGSCKGGGGVLRVGR